MTVRIRYFIGIFPLFLIVAVFLALLGYHLQLREILRGHTDEARAVAVSLAALLDTTTWEEETVRFQNGEPPGLALQRILDWDIAQRISAYTIPQERLAFTWPRRPDEPWPFLPFEWMERESDPHFENSAQTGLLTLHAYSRVLDPTGEVVGVIAVETNANSLVRERRSLLLQAYWLAGSIIILGALITYFMARFLSQQIGSLNSGIHSIINTAEDQSEEWDLLLRQSRIKEITELGQTFDVLNAVFEEEFKRIKQSLVEGEQFRDEAHLAATYAQALLPDREKSLPSLQYHIGRGGGFSPWHFFFEPENDKDSSLGGVLGYYPPSLSPLEAVLTAHAMETYLRYRQRNTSDQTTILEELNRLFAPASLVLWSYTKATVTVSTLTADRSPITAKHSLGPGRRILLTTLPENRARILRQFVSTYPSCEADRLFGQLQFLVPSSESGVMVLLQGGTKPSCKT